MSKFLFSIDCEFDAPLAYPDAICSTMESALDIQKQVKSLLPEYETSITEISDEEATKRLERRFTPFSTRRKTVIVS